MKKIAIPDKNLRDCPFTSCRAKSSLAYYKEHLQNDKYYCKKCFKVCIWNGEKIGLTGEEAYLNRDK
jgi:hypothetical protein